MATEYSGNNYDRILNYIKIIQRKPKKDVKFFYFDEGIKFIVDGNRLKLLPLEYHKHYSKDEFYVHVNPSEKRIMFYAYDIMNYTEEKHVNEEEGYMNWEALEDCIYNFFVLNVNDLADTTTPYVDVQDPSPVKKRISTYSPATYTHSEYGGYSHVSPHGYETPAYKEREAFQDKLWDLLKNNKSSQAMDHISAQIKKMRDEKKFEEMDVLFKMIAFDKLSIPAMLGMLETTVGIDSQVKGRKEFFDKVKTHITKVKPSRAGKILRKLEPVKEVKSVKKNDAGENKTV